MYGGVSLAVYINGVANELFRAVRGRGMYRLVKELTDSDVGVDVVSGTSAGGINGILLGFALSNGREFGPAAGVWRDGADIGALLRNPSDDNFASLLDSENVYQPRLEQVLHQMWATPVEASDDDESAVRELDLFVTGTDYNGRLSTTLDEAGHSIDVKDHRALFWLKHRKGRKEQLHPEADAAGRLPVAPKKSSLDAGVSALATLARITSCFPAAFTPVVVPAKSDFESEAYAKLRTWGRLDDEQSYCFLDGGVLDNKPFTSTIRTIFYRTADRPVRRHVLYVEPDPERFAKTGAPFRVPSFTESALDSLTKLPGYESIADDLRLVAEHNDKVDRLARIRAAVAQTSGAPSSGQRELWRKARLSALRDAMLRRLLGVEHGERLSEAMAARANELREQFDRQYLENVQESAYLLNDFDVGFRLRRLFHVTYTCDDAGVLAVVNRAIEFLEIVRHAMEEALSTGAEARGAASPADVWKFALRRLTVLLRLDADQHPFPRSRPEESTREPLSAAELERTKLELDRRLAGLTAEAAPAGDNVLAVSDRYELAASRAFGERFEKDYAAYEVLDHWLFPLEFVAGLYERDVIRVTRLSPLDAQRGLCKRELADKLCGDTLGHFGAFFKRSWRSNDILWGRLDGACQLVETLLARDWLSLTLSAKRSRPLLGCERTTPPAERNARVLDWLETHAIFPHAGKALRLEIAAELARLVDVAFANDRPVEETQAALLTHFETAWSRLVDGIVRAAHLEILDEELPKVVEDAAVEQMQWNQLATVSGDVRAVSNEAAGSGGVSFDATTFTFTANRRHFDPLLLALASRELATKALAKFRKRDDSSALEEYFRGYGVGSETVMDHVPRVVLLELGSRAALVLQNCLVESLPRPAEVRRHWLFRLFLDWPLRVHDAVARFLRYAPGARKPFVVATIAYVALALVVNVLWVKALYGDDGLQRQVAILLFVIGPAVCVLFSWLLIRPFRSARPSELGSRLGWLVALVVVASSIVGTLALLDADLVPVCSSAPLSALGERCSRVARGVILVVPVVAGVLLGALSARSARSARR
jgi:patatin-related protein